MNSEIEQSCFGFNYPYVGDMKARRGTSLVVQWLRVCLQCRGHRLIPGQGTKIPRTAEPALCNYRAHVL